MPRILIIAGLVLIVLGFIWPWIVKSGLGRLPGDILLKNKQFSFYMPLTTSLLVSLMLTLIIWLLKK